jgi:hypothetical protein
MRNIIGPPVVGDDLYGRDYELTRLWEHLENGELSRATLLFGAS